MAGLAPRGSLLPGRAGATRARSTRPLLRLGGLTPLTSIDYPGELAAVIFCQGCPWRCGYCHNPELLAPIGQDPLFWGDILGFLQRRQHLLDAVVFSGGEPTLQWALPEAVKQVRSLGFKVGLHTAGIYPRRLATLLPHLDWVGLDIKTLQEDYPALTGVPGSGARAWESLHLLLDAGTSLEVRTTLAGPVSHRGKVETLMRRLAQAGVTCYALQTPRRVGGPCQFGEEHVNPAGLMASQDAAIYAPCGQALFPHFELR